MGSEYIIELSASSKDLVMGFSPPRCLDTMIGERVGLKGRSKTRLLEFEQSPNPCL